MVAVRGSKTESTSQLVAIEIHSSVNRRRSVDYHHMVLVCGERKGRLGGDGEGVERILG